MASYRFHPTGFEAGVMSHGSGSGSGLTADTVFELLSSKRRRMVLYYLRQQREPLTVNELARQIASMENDVEVGDLTSQQQKRVYVSLYQTHLPKLESMGVIDYDKDAGRVALAEGADEIDTYLTEAPDGGYPWQLHYLGLAAASVVLTALSVVGVPVVSAIPPAWLGIAITVAFAMSALAHYLTRRRKRRELPPEISREED